MTTTNKIHIYNFDMNTSKITMVKSVSNSIKNFSRFELHPKINNLIITYGYDISLNIMDISQTSEGDILKIQNKNGKLDWHKSPIHSVLFLDDDANRMISIDDNGAI